MKKTLSLVLALLVLATLVSCGAGGSPKLYRDGAYEAKSRAMYTSEPYWGMATLTIKKGEIEKLEFQIKDTRLNKTVDESYAVVFEGNQEYIDQLNADYKGMQSYIAAFNETKTLEGLDATSGATWSYNIFVDTVKKALDLAKAK